MELTDTHAHLYLPQFDADRRAMLQRAFENKVLKIFLPNIVSTTVSSLLNLAEEFPGNCFHLIPVNG